MMLKLQSAMEYLMTYGWAILIIAVVLAALFQLGVFNPSTFAAKAQPGSCQVIRPDGPETSRSLTLSGACVNQLPQYVASLSSPAYIQVSGSELAATGTLTVSYWVYYISGGEFGLGQAWNEWRIFSDTAPNNLNIINMYGGVTNRWYTAWNWQKKTWYHITWVSGSGSEYLYVDGVQQATNTISGALTSPGSVYFGEYPTGNGFTGYLSNFQIYDTDLSANDISALYNEGIGGAPIDLQHLAGWWPLNGNANDYSGNQYDGTPTNVIYTGSWASSYYAP